MARGPSAYCGRGIHSFSDPRNVGVKHYSSGAEKRFCLPCDIAYRRTVPLPRLALAPTAAQLAVLQGRADGLSEQETADLYGVTAHAVRRASWKARERLRVTSSVAAAVAVCLAYELIKPDISGPLPPRGAQTAPYAASVLDLVQGRRAPLPPKDPRRLRLLDALYAWSEPHAVSILWAADVIKARDVAPLFAKRKR